MESINKGHRHLKESGELRHPNKVYHNRFFKNLSKIIYTLNGCMKVTRISITPLNHLDLDLWNNWKSLILNKDQMFTIAMDLEWISPTDKDLRSTKESTLHTLSLNLSIYLGVKVSKNLFIPKLWTTLKRIH